MLRTGLIHFFTLVTILSLGSCSGGNNNTTDGGDYSNIPDVTYACGGSTSPRIYHIRSPGGRNPWRIDSSFTGTGPIDGGRAVSYYAASTGVDKFKGTVVIIKKAERRGNRGGWDDNMLLGYEFHYYLCFNLDTFSVVNDEFRHGGTVLSTNTGSWSDRASVSYLLFNIKGTYTGQQEKRLPFSANKASGSFY